MTNDALPACQFRGEILEDGLVQCDCDKIAHIIPGTVPVRACLNCPFRDEITSQLPDGPYPPWHMFAGQMPDRPQSISKKKSSPGLFQKGLNYFRSLGSHILAGFPKTPEPVYMERLRICDTCDRRNPDSWECTECGCPMDEKAAWAEQECPLKKWLKVDPNAKPASLPPSCGSCGG